LIARHVIGLSDFSVDWVVADMLAERQGSIGHMRFILKDSLKFIPLYGSYFRQVSLIKVIKAYFSLWLILLQDVLNLSAVKRR